MRIKFADKLLSLGIKIDDYSLSDLFIGIGIPTSKYVKILHAFGKYIEDTDKINLSLFLLLI